MNTRLKARRYDKSAFATLPRFRKLRIAIVSDAITGRNGVGTYYSDLVDFLAPLVDAIELIAPDVEPNSELEHWSIAMPGDSTQRMVWPRTCYLEDRLRSIRPNVVVLPSVGAITYKTLRLSKRLGLPVAVVNHTSFERLLPLYFPGLLAKVAGGVLRRINNWLLRQADGVAAVSAESLEEARVVGAEAIRVVGTPLAKDFLQQPVKPLVFPLRRAIYVGRLAREKNLESILLAAEKIPDMEFQIVGDGPLRDVVASAAASLDNLDYLGWQPRSAVRELVDGSDLLLLPSKLETFGTVALEALARRRLVVTSAECGIAKWPSLAAGLFTVSERQTLHEALIALRKLSEVELRQHARSSWDAVRLFNDNTIRVWLSFLADTANLSSPSGSASSNVLAAETRVSGRFL